ncbi:MAG: response regulator [Lachnospiraceae bacterium]|nr:response regulator [Lachnospiraceae bacterium]
MSLREILLAIQCVCIMGVFTESVIIVKKWKNELHLYLLLSSIALLINEIGTLLELTAESSGEIFAALKFAYLGRVWYVFFLFLFVAELTHVKVPKALKNILLLIHMGTYGAILMIPYNDLYYTNVKIEIGGMFAKVVHGNGIMHHILMVLQILYTLIGIYLLFRAHYKAQSMRVRKCILTVFLAMLTQSIFFAVQLIGIPGLTDYYDVTMLGFFLGTILMIVAIFSFDLLGTIDIAKEFVIDKISEGIIAVDNKDTIQYYNASAVKLWPMLEAEDADTKEILADIKASAIEGTNLTIGDRIYTTKENDLVYRGEILGKLYAIVDDTEHYEYMKELEKQKAIADSASEAKSRFLANMSHEIRTPINAVLGFDEMILRETQEKSIRAYAADIMSAGKTLLSLINDILDFSKVEAGKMEIIPVQYELSSLINDLNNMIKDVASKKGLQFILNVNAQTPHLLIGDEIRIRQCMMNLLSNAVKYTETGSVTMNVSFHDVSEDEICLYFSVEDTGVGMKQEDMEKLFSPYKRINETRNRWVEGTGLGMGITKELLGLMGSSLQVETEYGKGTTVSFAVNQKVVSHDEIGDFTIRLDEASRKESVYRVLFQAPNARILVVDDTEMNLTVIQNLLKKTKIHIDTALSGRDAIVLAESTQYDVAFFDHMMADMDGIETLEAFRKTEKNQNTPAVALTANAISGARRMYLDAGFTDYLSKPVDGIKLEKMLFNLLPKDKVEKSCEAKTETKQSRWSEIPKILIIDDDEAVCTVIKTVLQSDYDINVSNKGSDAVRLARNIAPDLIMLDIHLGDVNGFTVMQNLKNNPQTADIPVLLVTGDNDTVVEENGFRSGASDYIRKPFVPEVLKQRVKRIIDLYHYQQYMKEEVEKQTSRSKRLSREKMLAMIDEDTEYCMNENASGSDIWKAYDRLWNDNNNTQPDAESMKRHELPEFLYTIPDVDVEAGVKNCGTAEGYLSVLTVFHQTAKAKAEEIDVLYQNGDITNYTIKVHALKSSARIIGAGKLSKMAEALESAGKKNDVDYMNTHTAPLLEMYRSLDLKLAALDADYRELPDIEKDALEEAYQTIIEIAESMDYGLMIGILNELKNYNKPAADQENIKEMENMLNELDFEGISRIASNAIQNMEDSDGK